MSVNINNFDKICRTCLIEKANMRPIFDAFVADMLMGCADVQIIESDGLPKSICMQCLQQVNRSYSFKQLCEKSDNSLRQCLKQSRSHLDVEVKEEERENNENTDRITINKESVQYRIHTEQLKLEISEHLKLDIKQGIDFNHQSEIPEDEDITKMCSKSNLGEECGDNFKCNECEKSFKGKIIC